jgi:hypothetical protein
MSLGFTTEQTKIGEMIERVTIERKRKLLLFAAAGNHGKNGKEDFPSNHHWVFSVHATDHLGNISKFDTGLTHARPDYLATLGESIPGPPSLPGPYSGTSFSTPIAAAIAGLVIDAARHSIAAQAPSATTDSALVTNGESLGVYDDLRTMGGMKKVFLLKELTPNVHNGSRTVAPLQFCACEEPKRREILDYAVGSSAACAVGLDQYD